MQFSISNSTHGTSSFSFSHAASDRATSSTHKSQPPTNSDQATPLTSYHSSCSKCRDGLPTDFQTTEQEQLTCSEEQNAENTQAAVQTSFLKSIGKRQPKTEKVILQEISLYFNPGELIGIMGPSGKKI